jgi:hypothetical protein
MQFAPKHVVTMVVAVCVAAVLAPVGVMAATGTLVNITDPYDSSRRAKVGSTGTLTVESRAGAPTGSWNTFHENITDVIGHTLVEAVNPNRLALTEATFTLHGDNTASTNHVRIYSQVRTSGSNPCGGAGWTTPKTLRTVVVRAGSTVQLQFSGPPLLAQTPATGQKVCLRFQQTKWTGSTSLDVATTGYTFK